MKSPSVAAVLARDGRVNAHNHVVQGRVGRARPHQVCVFRGALERYTDSIGRFPGAFKRRQKLKHRLVHVLAWSFAAMSLAEPFADSSKKVA